jgi:gas vesicle protein
MKNGFAGFLKFAAGSAVGATLGAAIGVLMAPKSGDQTQADTAAFVQTARAEGEQARQQAEARVAARFRDKVHDPSALSSQA